MFQMRSACKFVILTAIVIANAPACGLAATIVGYDFTSGYGVTEAAPDIDTTVFSAGSAITDVSLDPGGNPGQAWFGKNWTVSDDAGVALASNSYAYFRVTPQPGYAMDLSSITIDVRPHGSGPDDFLVSIVDISTNTSAQFGGLLSHSGLIDLPSEFKTWETLSATSGAFQNLTGTQEIRIYGFDANQADREVLFDNIRLNGSISPIPEPTVFLLLSLASGFLGCCRRRYCTASAPMDSLTNKC